MGRLFQYGDTPRSMDFGGSTYTTESTLHGTGKLMMGSDGWTDFEASESSRIMYVSEDGNDGTGQIYGSTDFADPFEPSGEAAFATYAGAVANARNGSPDWVLFRRGDTFTAQLGAWSGSGAADYALIGAYGSSGALPIVKPTSTTADLFVKTNSALQYFAITGIDCYAEHRDPDAAAYSTTNGGRGFWFYTDSATISDVLIEGCKFRFFHSNELSVNGGAIESIVLRRSSILDNYSNGAGHSQGMWAEYVDGLVLEENIFDHNGWYSQAGSGGIGEATQFNHNTYMSKVQNTTFKSNVFSRGSSGLNKFTADVSSAANVINDLTIDNNLYFDGEVALSIGGNDTEAYRFVNVTIKNNVLTEIGRSQSTNRTIGWGMWLQDWDGGTVQDNYILHFSNTSVDDVFAISHEGGSRNVSITGNVVYGLEPSATASSPIIIRIPSTAGQSMSGMTVSSNIFQEVDNEARIIDIADDGDLAAFTFSGNKYYVAAAGNWFESGATAYDFSGWGTHSGDDSTWEEVTFADATRNLATYMQSLGETATLASFLDATRGLGRYVWDDDYAAPAVNTWIKAGF